MVGDFLFNDPDHTGTKIVTGLLLSKKALAVISQECQEYRETDQVRFRYKFFPDLDSCLLMDGFDKPVVPEECSAEGDINQNYLPRRCRDSAKS